MSAINTGRSQAKELRASERDQKRGYSINYKQVGLAFAIEIVVVILSLIGAWLMASKYGRTSTDYVLMMLAPVSYAMVEFSRVPLALATRTQRNHFMKVVAVLGRSLCGGRHCQIDVHAGRNYVQASPRSGSGSQAISGQSQP